MKTYSVADLFSGCGGFSLGFEAEPAFRTRIAVDVWDKALATLKHNNPKTECLVADLSDPDKIDEVVNLLGKDLDVLLGGPPCQGFSTLGKRRDNDHRSTLVDSFSEICVRVRPKIILVENVRGITSKKHPVHASYAEALLHKLSANGARGYECSAQVLNAADFGVPQNRMRWFMLAVRRDLPNAREVGRDFWQKLVRRTVLYPRTLGSAIYDLPRLLPGEESTQYIQKGKRNRKIFNHRAMRHSPELLARLKHIPKGGGLPDVPAELLTPHLKKMLDGGYGSGGHVKNIYGRMDWDSPSGTIVAGIDKITCGRFVHPEDHRLLTPRECARIQTFPDRFEFLGGQVAQYYQVGNAVPPKLAQVLAETLASAMDKINKTNRQDEQMLEVA
ncbi:DNA cytosine methyltransferase [Sphingomonas sp. PB2P12]|uniref:DNA cytosine methyltransferase n=1 Tax=Sphingomonas sandaracina TaxID=3096157 RepID=UPI002FCACED2